MGHMTTRETDVLAEWIEIYENTRKTTDRPSDTDAAINRADKAIESLEAEIKFVEARLRSEPPLPAPLPDPLAHDRNKLTQLREERDAWRAFRDRIREETGR